MLTRSRSQFTFSKALWTSIGVLLVTVIFGVVNAAAGYSDIRREAEDSCNEFYQSNIYFAYNAAASESLEVGFDSPIVEGYITFPVTVATGGTYYVWVRLRTTSVNADNTIEVDVNNASVSVFVVTWTSFQRHAVNQQPNVFVTWLNYITISKQNLEAGTYVVSDKLYITDNPVGEVVPPNGIGWTSSSACDEPSCILYTGVYVTQPATDTSNACTIGTYVDLTDTAEFWKRSCTDTGSASVVCEADKPHCGDAICNNSETCLTCEQDCGICPIGGDCKDYTWSYYSQPASNTTNGCRSGTYQDTGDLLNQRKWLCLGTGWWSNDLCVATRLYCGDNQCNAPNETCSSCPSDCGICWDTTADCYPYSGSYATQPAKNDPTWCAVGSYQDTGDTSTERQRLCRWSWGNNDGCFHGAPDGICQPLAGETPTNCYDDCGGNGIWSPVSGGLWGGWAPGYTGMLAILCTADKEICGDKVCNNSETCSSCPSDCGACSVDGVCESYTGAYITQPANSTSDGCLSGLFLDENNTDTGWVWNCLGEFGWSDALCTADIFFPTVSIANASAASEGAPSTFTVTLNTTWWFPVYVSYMTYNGTAKAGSDFVAKSDILTIPIGSLTGVIIISWLQDTLDESLEDFFVTLSNPVSATISDGIAEGTIIDDDDSPTISIADASLVYEGDDSSFLVSLSTGSWLPTSVVYTTIDGTAVSGADYVAATGTLTIPAGSTTGLITIQGLEDLIDENDETFSVILSSPTNVTLDDMTGSASIADNDLAPTIAVNSPVAITEGNPITFTITIDTPSWLPVTVNYVTSWGTAFSWIDYTSVYGTATIAAGLTGTTVDVSTMDDSWDEDTETFLLRLSNPVNATSGTMTGIGTISDNDGIPTVSITSPTAVVEGNPTTFVVTLSAVSGLPVTVNYTSSWGTATSWVDYTSVNGQASIPAGSTGTTIVVNTTNDTLDEADTETFTLFLHTPTNTTIRIGTGIWTITDNDSAPSVNVNSPAAATEGSSITFTVSLNTPSGLDVTVNYATSWGTATSWVDYTSVNGQASIPAGSTGTTVVVNTTNDTLDENSESFSLVLTAPSNATIGTNPWVGTISDNDAAPTVSVDSPAAVIEGSSITFTVSLNTPSGLDVTVNYATSWGTSSSWVDYTSVNGQASIPAGSTGATVVVNTTNDTLDENSESFSLVLTAPSNATIGTNPWVGTISDDDTTTVSIDDTSANEWDPITFTVTLSLTSVNTVTVNFTTLDGTAVSGADYTSTGAVLSFAPGVTSRTIVVQTIENLIDAPNKSFSLQLSSPSNATITDGTGIATIIDDDGTPTINIADSSANEGDNMSFRVSLWNPSAGIVTFQYTTIAGTATAGSDYLSRTWTGTISAGITWATVIITGVEDILDEPDETMGVVISNPINADLGDSNATGTIIDDDDMPQVSVDSPAAVIEGNNITFTVSLNTPSGLDVTVNYATSWGTATSWVDYTSVNGQASIPAGSTGTTVVVNTTNDTLDENSESFSLVLTAPSNATIGTNPWVGTISDNDAAPTVSVDSPAAVIEGSSITFTISLNTPSGLDVTVNYATSWGTASSWVDYTSVNGQASIPAGSTGTTVLVSTIDDNAFETAETFKLLLSNPTNATLGTASWTGTITDNDSAPTVSIDTPAPVSEGSGITFTISLNTPLSALLTTVSYRTIWGTATSGIDYTSVYGTITFTGWNTGATITIPTTDDDIDELDSEYFTVWLSSPSNATIGTNPWTGTINDNDAMPVMTISGVTVAETAGTATLQLTLTNPSRQTITANYMTVPWSASSWVDYLSKNGVVVFGPWATGATVSGSIVNDPIYEPTEQYDFRLSSPTNATISSAVGTVTITDNDLPPIVNISSPADVDEGEPVVFPVTLTTVSGYPTTVTYSTYDDSALSGTDYIASSGNVMIAVWMTGTTITIATVNDAVEENTESFTVRLSSGVNATMGIPVGTGTIIDNDLVCGFANGQTTIDPPTTGLCVSSTVTGMTIGAVQFSRHCINQTEDLTCTSSRIRNGICGSADGQTGSVAPISWLCFVGNTSIVTLSWAVYLWTCGGINGGTTASCYAPADEEECDDGNNVSGDGCNNICVIEYCGDGVTDTNGIDNILGTVDDEQCDDGNNVNGDSCSSTCKHEYCGDGWVDADGSDNNASTTGDNELCDTGRFCSDGTSCTDNPRICPGDCITRFVGNCSPNCTYGTCGDGYVDPNGADNTTWNADDEQCDGGSFCPNGIPCNHDASLCPGQCAPVFTIVCLNTCKSLYCGDGFVDLDGPDNDLTTVADNEACDDGNTLLGDGCNDVCQLEAPDVLCEEEFTCPVGYILKYVTQTQQYYCEQTQYTGATYTP